MADSALISQHVDAGAGLIERAVRIDGKAGRLAGILTETGLEGPVVRPVLIVHGWSTYRIGPHGLLVQLARAIARSGAPALRFDFRGRGESDGDYLRTDLDGMIADTALCAEWLSERYGVDEVAGFGMCAGGNVAAAAAALGAKIAPLVVVGMLPYQSEKTGVERSARARHMRRVIVAKLFRAETWRKLFTGRIRWGRVLGNLGGGETETASKSEPQSQRNLKDSSEDVPAALARYEGKLLFIFGSADEEGTVGRQHFERFAEANRLDAFFHIVEGANHNFYSAEWTRQLINRTLDFLAINRGSLPEQP